jgi:hypothetical protein
MSAKNSSRWLHGNNWDQKNEKNQASVMRKLSAQEVMMLLTSLFIVWVAFLIPKFFEQLVPAKDRRKLGRQTNLAFLAVVAVVVLASFSHG